MDEQVPQMLFRALDPRPHARRGHRPGVADLTARFAVERRLVQNDEAGLPGPERVRLLAALDERGDHAFGRFGLIAEELGRADALTDGVPEGFGRGLAGARPGGARLLALALHGGVEGVEID